MNSNGPYLDFGVGATSNSVGTRDTRAGKRFDDVLLYGRVVVPLGEVPDRIDCSRLYELEIERLKTELELMKMGIDGNVWE